MERAFSLRPACGQDAQALAAIYAPYVRDTCITFEYDPPDSAEFARRIRDISARFPYLVCEVDGKPAAYAYASPFHDRAAFQWDAELSIYVSPAFHRQGIAAALYGRLFQLLRGRGYLRLYALISLPNEASIGFHISQGFTKRCVYPQTGYKHGAWRDLLVMDRLLAPLPACPKLIPAERKPAPARAEPGGTAAVEVWQKKKKCDGGRKGHAPG